MSFHPRSRFSHPSLASPKLIWTVGAVLLSLETQSVFAVIPREVEPEYALAVLAFHDRDYPKAVAILAPLKSEGKKIREALEMQALALKLDKRPEEALQVYLELSQLLRDQNAPLREIGPVEFEVGMILVSLKRPQDAIPHFEKALEAKTNPGTSSLYIGLGAMKNADWEKSSQAFQNVLQSTRTELHPAGALYLGQSYSQMGFPAGAIDAFQKTLKLSNDAVKNPTLTPASQKMISEIKGSAETALTPYDQSRYFGNLSLLTGYDSNLLAVPNSIASDPSGKASIQGLLLGGAGYISSPLAEYQWTPSYRFFYNNNASADASLTEFLNHSASFAVNRNSLGVFSQGLKLDGNWTFRNDGEAFANYSMRGTVTAYASYFLSPGIKVSGEAFAGIQDFPSDPDTEDLQRSGSLAGAKISIRKVRGSRWVNPSADLSLSKENTAGTEYRSQTSSLGIGNRLIVTPKIDIIPSIDLAWVQFNERTQGARNDFLIAAQVSGQWRFLPNWAALATVGFAKNSSNLEESFSYQRSTVNSGISYNY